MKHQKKRDKCIQMHYIGKSYVNTVYKSDDGKKSDHSEKKVWLVYTMHYIGRSYETTVYECDDEKKSDHSEKKVWQVYTMHYIGKSYETTVYKCDDEKKKIERFLGQIFFDDSEKKAWQVYTNALHREKLCKHCIQVWQQTETSCHKRIYGTNIFWWSTKKAWQVYTMHYIGKSYVTTVYKCDDEKIDPFFVWNNCNICRQCIRQKHTFSVKQTETSYVQYNIWDTFFLVKQ